MESKKNMWLITDVMEVTSKVTFPKEVSKEEALHLWASGEYGDVLDTYDGAIVDLAKEIK